VDDNVVLAQAASTDESIRYHGQKGYENQIDGPMSSKDNEKSPNSKTGSDDDSPAPSQKEHEGVNSHRVYPHLLQGSKSSYLQERRQRRGKPQSMNNAHGSEGNDASDNANVSEGREDDNDGPEDDDERNHKNDGLYDDKEGENNDRDHGGMKDGSGEEESEESLRKSKRFHPLGRGGNKRSPELLLQDTTSMWKNEQYNLAPKRSRIAHSLVSHESVQKENERSIKPHGERDEEEEEAHDKIDDDGKEDALAPNHDDEDENDKENEIRENEEDDRDHHGPDEDKDTNKNEGPPDPMPESRTQRGSSVRQRDASSLVSKHEPVLNHGRVKRAQAHPMIEDEGDKEDKHDDNENENQKKNAAEKHDDEGPKKKNEDDNENDEHDESNNDPRPSAEKREGRQKHVQLLQAPPIHLEGTPEGKDGPRSKWQELDGGEDRNQDKDEGSKQNKKEFDENGGMHNDKHGDEGTIKENRDDDGDKNDSSTSSEVKKRVNLHAQLLQDAPPTIKKPPQHASSFITQVSKQTSEVVERSKKQQRERQKKTGTDDYFHTELFTTEAVDDWDEEDEEEHKKSAGPSVGLEIEVSITPEGGIMKAPEAAENIRRVSRSTLNQLVQQNARIERKPQAEHPLEQKLRHSHSGSQIYTQFYLGDEEKPAWLIPDTGSTMLWTDTSSSSFIQESSILEVKFGTGQLSGPIGTDNLCLKKNNGKRSDNDINFCTTVSMARIKKKQGIWDNDVNGILGMAMPQMMEETAPSHKTGSFFQQLVRSGVLPKNEVTFTMPRQGNKGSVFWGGRPKNLIQGKLHHFPVTKSKFWTMRLLQFRVGCCCISLKDGKNCDQDQEFPDTAEGNKQLQETCLATKCKKSSLLHTGAESRPYSKEYSNQHQHLIADTGTTFESFPKGAYHTIKRMGLLQKSKCEHVPGTNKLKYPTFQYELYQGEGRSHWLELTPEDYLVRSREHGHSACTAGFMHVDAPKDAGPAAILGQSYLANHAMQFKLHCSTTDASSCRGIVGLGRTRQDTKTWKKHTAVDYDPQSNRESVLDEEDKDDAAKEEEDDSDVDGLSGTEGNLEGAKQPIDEKSELETTDSQDSLVQAQSSKAHIPRGEKKKDAEEDKHEPRSDPLDTVAMPMVNKKKHANTAAAADEDEDDDANEEGQRARESKGQHLAQVKWTGHRKPLIPLTEKLSYHETGEPSRERSNGRGHDDVGENDDAREYHPAREPGLREDGGEEPNEGGGDTQDSENEDENEGGPKNNENEDARTKGPEN